eukprot:491251-Rhodomonas_salina.4
MDLAQHCRVYIPFNHSNHSHAQLACHGHTDVISTNNLQTASTSDRTHHRGHSRARETDVESVRERERDSARNSCEHLGAGRNRSSHRTASARETNRRDRKREDERTEARGGWGERREREDDIMEGRQVGREG